MITEGYLVRHFQGRRGGRGPAIIDIALKGGTALRKFWAGNAGRFSTDLDFAEMPDIPVARLEETIAEKLARYRRGSLARDLYDLAWASAKPFDEVLVRRLLVLKVWTDVVDDGLGESPFDPEEILRERSPDEFKPEAIGYLTTPVDVPGWIAAVRGRFGFLSELDEDELRWSRCSKGEEWEARQAIAALGAWGLEFGS